MDFACVMNLKTQSRTIAEVRMTLLTEWNSIRPEYWWSITNYKFCATFVLSEIRGSIMKTSSLIAMRIIIFYLLSVVGRSTAAIEEAPASSLHIPRLNPLSSNLEYDEPSEKRAYAYISEYKRLPLYNFGIGKRWIDNSEDKVSSGWK